MNQTVEQKTKQLQIVADEMMGLLTALYPMELVIKGMVLSLGRCMVSAPNDELHAFLKEALIRTSEVKRFPS
jgi:hypothetical protein